MLKLCKGALSSAGISFSFSFNPFESVAAILEKGLDIGHP